MRHPAPRRLPGRLALALLAVMLLAPATAAAAPAPLAAPFPRIAAWWPPSGVTSAVLARHDLVVFHDFDRPRASEVRALHPDAVILDSTDACEVPFDPFDATDNDELRAIPAQWLLTQAGSTLAAPVSASDSTFRVAAVTAPDGSHLFEPGEAVVVDDELARIESIAGTTLTVRRGRVKAPAAHAGGARVASAVSYWHGYLVTDLSANCPRLTAVGGPGPETWAEYASRNAAALVTAPPWDGLFVDRADGDASWLVTSGAARSIDVDRSNRVPASYDTFDESWNAGLRGYEQRLRTAVGPARILVTNWGRPEYDLVNGDCFEAFPGADGRSYNGTWQQTTFGPLAGSGGYLQWDSSAAEPRTSMIAQYRLDEPQREPRYGEPAALTMTDVRKARFGIGTALLGDGFYSYTLNDAGADSATAAWFDTYDGGGLGKGFLGRASGAAARALPALATPDLVALGGFASQTELDGWPLWLRSGYAGSVALVTASSPAGDPCARVTLTQTAGKQWEAHLTRGGVAPVSAGSEYTVSFWAKADRARTMSVWVQGDGDDTRQLVDFGEVALETAWRRYEVSMPALASTGPAGTRLHFGFGASTGSVWLDGIRLQQGSTAVWRRDFTGGLVVVNASSAPKTVELGGWFQAFRGVQDPEVDDGRILTAVTVPPLDARVLVRPVALALPQLDRAGGLWRRVVAAAEAARARCAAEAARSTGIRARRLLAAATGWQHARDAAQTALSAEVAARNALALQDTAASRLYLDAAVASAATAANATVVRDPMAGRSGRAARRAALAAFAFTSQAHDSLP